MNAKRLIIAFVVSVVVLPILAFATVRWLQDKYEQLPVLGGSEHRIGDFNLSDAAGNKISLTEWNNKVVVVNFFFTHCPSVCPKMMGNLRKVQNAFKSGAPLLINSISVDPERDSVSTLAAYSKRFKIDQSNWNLLTGDKKEIYRLARKSFLVTATDGDGGENDFIHSDQFILIDGKHRIRGYYSGVSNNAVNQLISDIKKLNK